MNLHAIASPAIRAVNPSIPVELRISAGSSTNADGSRTPAFETPGSITASIAGSVLTVTAKASGTLDVGQGLADLTAALAPGTVITRQLTGSVGGIGTYSVNREQTVASETMTTILRVPAQVQPVTWRDIQQLDGLNIQGIRWKVYLYGAVNGLVRPERKGGDLIIIANGPHQGTWLVAQVLEQFPDWVSAGITLQNGG